MIDYSLLRELIVFQLNINRYKCLFHFLICWIIIFRFRLSCTCAVWTSPSSKRLTLSTCRRRVTSFSPILFANIAIAWRPSQWNSNLEQWSLSEIFLRQLGGGGYANRKLRQWTNYITRYVRTVIMSLRGKYFAWTAYYTSTKRPKLLLTDSTNNNIGKNTI